MSSPARVGEIFSSAGAAFDLLGKLTTDLHSTGDPTSTKWTEQEVKMLQDAVSNFVNDLQRISDTIKSKTVNQIKGTLQKKAFAEAGLALPSASQSATTNSTLSTTDSVISSSTTRISETSQEQGRNDADDGSTVVPS